MAKTGQKKEKMRKTVANTGLLCYDNANFRKGDEMLKKYLMIFLVSMVPMIELRGGVPMAVTMGLDYWKALIVCIIGNMLR